MMLLREIGKGLGALLVAAAIWEGILRVLIASPVPYHHHATLGWMPQPGSRGLNTLEGRGVVAHNQLGFRDEPLAAKQPGELRIACLGDSYTAGWQMDVSLAFPARLQSLLRDDLTSGRLKGPTSIRVVNAGRPGTVASYSVALADEYRKLLEPDWVVLQVRDGWEELFLRTHEFHYKEAGGEAAAETGEAFEIKNRWNKDQMSGLKRRMIALGARDLALGQYGLRRLSQMTEKKAPRKPGSRFEERNLRAIEWTVQELRKRYPRLVLVHIPPASMDRAGLAPASAEEKRLVEACRQFGVPLITMRDAFEGDYPQSLVPSHGFANTIPWSGHPNRHAHGLIAEELRKFFGREAVLQP